MTRLVTLSREATSDITGIQRPGTNICAKRVRSAEGEVFKPGAGTQQAAPLNADHCLLTAFHARTHITDSLIDIMRYSQTWFGSAPNLDGSLLEILRNQRQKQRTPL